MTLLSVVHGGQLTLKENSGILMIKLCKMVTQHSVPNISLCHHMHTCISRAERATFIISFQCVYVNKIIEFKRNVLPSAFPTQTHQQYISLTRRLKLLHIISLPLLKYLKEHTRMAGR